MVEQKQEQNENKRDKSTEEEERGIIWDEEEAGSLVEMKGKMTRTTGACVYDSTEASAAM